MKNAEQKPLDAPPFIDALAGGGAGQCPDFLHPSGPRVRQLSYEGWKAAEVEQLFASLLGRRVC
jgi:hypothetical protein